MPPKQQLDKAAWQWAETVNPEDVSQEHVEIAYRFNLKRCKAQICKRNCKGNPHCLNCIGERVWFGEIDENSWHDIEDPNSERREDGMFVGLKNLGATCYVNTFLQLWFHNKTVRQALYRYREIGLDQVNITEDSWAPSSIGGHLQLLFALLEHSERQFIDPKVFIEHLGLDAGLQQDAQEFSKLFLNLLEDSLSQQLDPTVRFVIQNQFCGEYAYVTTCSQCGNSSQCPSKFYELDLSIRGHKTLEDSLKDFLKEEKLEGDNQYMCSVCSKKQNAIRTIQLQNLPPVLNLQLLRFVFDKKTGHKKKLNSFIQFPEVLDMSKFIVKKPKIVKENEIEIIDIDPVDDDMEGNALYNLTAVLIHRGPTAYSGHYIAHIKDMNSKTWYKYNDEEIEKMKGSNLHLGTEDDPQEGQGKQKGRIPKGSHGSKNAYMLVYTRQKEVENNSYSKEDSIVSRSLIPQHIKDYVDMDNEKFEMWVAEMMLMRDRNIETGKEQQELTKEIYLKLIAEDVPPSKMEWLGLKWLNTWLEEPSKAPAINNKVFLCQHGKLDPHCAVKLKCVSAAGANMLFSQYHGGPRLKVTDSLCLTCVKQHCNMIRLKIKMVDDEKFLGTSMKVNNIQTNVPSFWVGKASLRSWKRLAMERLEGTRHDKENRGDGVEGHDEEVKEEQTGSPRHNMENKEVVNGEVEHNLKSFTEEATTSNNRNESVKEDEEEEDGSDLKFNFDVLCDHDKLDPDISCRKLIPDHVWDRLRKYFPDCPEFPQDTPSCDLCNKMNKEEQESKEMHKLLATKQKAALSELFADKKRPINLNTPQEVNVVSAAFVEEWRNFIREPLKREPVKEVLNCTLLCNHLKYLYPPANSHPDLVDHGGKVVYLWPREWEVISQTFAVDYEISIVKTQDEDGTVMVFTLPEVCVDCVDDRIVKEEQAKFEFKDATVYVRKVPKDQKLVNTTDMEKEDDPDFVQQNTNKSRASFEEPPEKMMKLEDGTRRKSQRHRKSRGEKELKVSSTDTLKELKLQIMKLFSVPPFDQNLTVSGVSLMDDTATLGSLMVSPGAVIMLQADEPVEDPMVLQDLIQVSSGPEAGFKGTGLLGH
ncbi:ubiquitin carboxyl-terminal hydrolase 48-like [Mizuhopecten yessoensis]|uniref:Ubiquitin carboxyl-terminal hydrolase 48 n=1 Tax=Mizuhopecten yessoensis TaxID=6573 RepID=A0A210R3G9_MIZYE|nr:ubiquitin carboxyl-terminal hydrolase 48-like [Mizuhopecten yessoensis]OWF55603.1 Ubiquitin carboxyl-terminal hydrolase 48 [Mizuhopecten yessoensis]